MTISLDDRLMEGLRRYAESESLNLERLAAEALAQYQVRMRIDSNGVRYPAEAAGKDDGLASAAEGLKKKLSAMIDGTETVRYGDVLAKLEADVFYFIGEYEGRKVLLVCNEEKDAGALKGTIELKGPEKNQAYCWLVPYDRHAVWMRLIEGKGLLLVM